MNTIKQIAELFDAPEAHAIEQCFNAMGTAEEEINAAKLRHPEAAEAIHASFRHLLPGAFMRGKAQQLYRAHCAELLDRVAAGGDVVPATDAEVACALSEASLIAPLKDDALAVYCEVFDRIFPDKLEQLPYLDPTRNAQTLAEIRAKIQTGRSA